MSDLTIAINMLLSKQKDYEIAKKYYEGAAEEVIAAPKIRRALKRAGDQFRLNFASTAVDAVNNRLEIASVSAISEAANTYLDRVMATNEMQLEIGQVHKHALVFGDAYLVFEPSEDFLQVYYNDPRQTIVIYDDENPKLKRYAAKVWQVADDNSDRPRYKTRVNLYYADRIEKFISVGNKLPLTPRDSDFIPYVDTRTNSDGVMGNPFGFVPVFHFRTEHPEGRPEHLKAYGAQDMITKLAVSQMASIDFHGFPQRYALSGAASSEASDFDEDSPENTQISNNPGEMLWLTNVEKVGQFDAAKPETYLDPLRVYIRSLATITATPLHYFEPTGNVPSGEALRTAEAPLVKKTKTRQLSFGATWREVFTAILNAAGMREDVQVHWKSAETFDTKESWEIARIKAQVGLPFAQNMAEMGYDPALVASWETAEGITPVQPSDTAPLDDGTADGTETTL